ncbi:MAG: transcription antitermination factor NusB [Proteobacteria bacterium]|jgi:N utilization substance protein B|nr:transcription antitermination factor NusB [Alphaproteobacteria bacterium]NCC02483.1 transcription antitermination factor NusB [Pseudomonadota bacterium]
MSAHKNKNFSKRLARLSAVQALFQSAYEEESVDEILARMALEGQTFLNDEELEGEDIPETPDIDLMRALVLGVVEHQPALEEVLDAALGEDRSKERMEKLLKTILIAGIYELYYCPEVASGIIINDYVDVTRAFFQGKESKLVNALLDRIGKKLRA